MSKDKKISRRNFVKLCTSAITMVSANPTLLASTDTAQRFHRVKLVNKFNQTIRPEDLKVGENYIFHYPYVTTPCFLINLGQKAKANSILSMEDGEQYVWQGGVGPDKSIVAFSAICAHKMSHPTKKVSFINYRHESTQFFNQKKALNERPQIIYCCSERSVYDPTAGAKVLGGPAPQPLAAVTLEYNKKENAIYATGSYGGEQYERFFNTFSFRLSLEFKSSNVKKKVKNTAPVIPVAEFCSNEILC